MTDKILTFTLSNGDVVEYSESEICDVIEKLENFQRTLKARMDMNKSITKDDIVDEITLAKLDAENNLCNLLLALLEVDENGTI